MTNNSPLLLHIPHASTVIPPEEIPRFCHLDLGDEQMKMTDRYCDELFSGYDSVIFPEGFFVRSLRRNGKNCFGGITILITRGSPKRWRRSCGFTVDA